MNIYSRLLVILGLILLLSAEFVHEALTYVAFVLIVLGFLLPFIITKITGQHFKGN
ncbi:MAG: hypothetical protein ACXQTP_05870 [Candidatus Methanofastidiosia archaeon]